METLSLYVFLGLSICTALIITYFMALPKPLPGLPFMPESRNSLFGSLPAALAHQKRTGSLFSYFAEEMSKRNEPIMQFFMMPFSRPEVWICDAREGSDIMTRRIKEFDHSQAFGDAFSAHVPQSSITFPTNADWQYNRRLLGEVMLPEFLYGAAVNHAYEAFNELVVMWREKARLADDRPFNAAGDTHMAATDAICNMTFGQGSHACAIAAAELSKIDKIDANHAENGPSVLALPTIPSPPLHTAVKTLIQSGGIGAVFGHRIYWLALKVMPHLRKAQHVRDEIVGKRLQEIIEKHTSKASTTVSHIASAMDIAVRKEISLADKENRAEFGGKVIDRIHDELCLFLAAGASTSADIMSWGIKRLTAHQDIQRELRAEMEQELKKSLPNGTSPSAEWIARTSLPKLSAFMEEVLRCHSLSSFIIRTATRDTTILGHFVPKHTEVCIVIDGRSMTSPPFDIAESKRSWTSKQTASQEKWSRHDDLHIFRPDRWLVESDNGSVTFDSSRHHMSTFGEGPRSCFGKKFAYLEMKIAFVLMLWNFEMLPLPDHLMDFDIDEQLTKDAKNVRLRLRSIDRPSTAT